jgi:hypothetical protein
MRQRLAVVAIFIGVLLTQVGAAQQSDNKCRCIWPWPENCNSVCRSGTWIAENPGGGDKGLGGSTLGLTFNFKIDGDKLTGFISTGGGDLPISDVKVKDDEISFTVTTSTSMGDMKALFKGKIEGDEIKFTFQTEGSDLLEKFTAKKKAKL